jgi:hypothetical protein
MAASFATADCSKQSEYQDMIDAAEHDAEAESAA